jgi:hypothetical protein
MLFDGGNAASTVILTMDVVVGIKGLAFVQNYWMDMPLSFTGTPIVTAVQATEQAVKDVFGVDMKYVEKPPERGEELPEVSYTLHQVFTDNGTWTKSGDTFIYKGTGNGSGVVAMDGIRFTLAAPYNNKDVLNDITFTVHDKNGSPVDLDNRFINKNGQDKFRGFILLCR